jgi:hypothetical protein
MRQTHKLALSVCATCLILSGCYDWDWKPVPLVGSFEAQALVGSEGEQVKCVDPQFNDYTCLSSKDIADLKIQIEKVKKHCK